MNFIHTAQTPKGQPMVVIPRKEYDRLLRMAARQNDDFDVEHLKKQIADVKSGKIKTIPHDVVVAITVGGVHPVRAWRDYRAMTAAVLAKASGVSRAVITLIETRKRQGTLAVHRALAKALGTTIDALID